MTDEGADRPLPQVRWLPTGPCRMPFVELGDPDGPPVVMLPGLSDGLAPLTEPRTRAMLAGIPFPMERFRCLVVSYPFPLGPVETTRDLADAAAGALRRLLDEPAVLVCHSLGGMVAQHLALDAPDLVAGQILSATVARADGPLRRLLTRWDDWLRAGDAVSLARDALETSFTGEERRRRRAGFDASEVPDPEPALVARHLGLSAACASHDALERLSQIRCPTLVLAGEEDVVAPVGHAHQLAARIPRARLTVLPDVGHAFPEQDPDRYQAHVIPFLDTLPRRPRGASAIDAS